ncbi:MAG TPA: ABC transporter substrate-binding protein [Candidatus Limnocylindria bacterium]|nr:ABC transporter substrate-binding protein [Candidatus Limnocylindria bacterium]
MSRFTRAITAVAVVAVLAACGADGAATSGSPTASGGGADACQPDSLDTLAGGRLTIGTDNPAFPPYWAEPEEGEEATEPWELGDPYNKRGFEGAVAWAVAEELGFAEDDVDFVAVPFDNSFAPGEKDFDFYLAQVSYTPERAEQVDMSDGYYFSNQSLVANADTPITEIASIEDLKEYRLGAQVGTTAFTYIEEQIQPDTEAAVYNSNDAAIAALNAGQIDGIVVDLPTAFFITAVQMETGVVVGQFPPAEGEDQEYFSLVLEKDSPLTDCVNQAIASLWESGELDAITEEWMSENTGVPVLE